MVFCQHCGMDLSALDADFCPSCGTPQNNARSKVKIPYILNQFKSPGKTLTIALIAGIFALLGIGHLYINKTRKGIIILIIGGTLWILSTFLFPPLFIIYIPLWIWQAYDSYRLAQTYNDYITQNGKAPW